MDIEKIKTLADYIREMEDEEIKAASEDKDAAFIELFTGESAPTAEQIAQYAEDNELDIEEVFQKITDTLHDLLTAKEEEEKKEGEEEEDELDEAEDPTHEAEETPEEEAEEHASGEELPDELPGEEEMEVAEFPYAPGDAVAFVTDNPDVFLFDKKLTVKEVRDVGNGDGFVQVEYLDEDGNEIPFWLRVDQVELKEKGSGDYEEEEEESEGGEEFEEPEVSDEDFGEEEEDEDDRKNESWGILHHMKAMGLYSIKG